MIINKSGNNSEKKKVGKLKASYHMTTLSSPFFDLEN